MKKIFALIVCYIMLLSTVPVYALRPLNWDGVLTLPEDDGSGYPVTGVSTEEYQFDSDIEEVVVPENIIRLGSKLFVGCYNLDKITLHENIQVIGEDCFSGTAYYDDERSWDQSGVLYIGNCLICADPERIGSEYEIRPGTYLIADGAFRGCSTLEKVTIPDSVRFVGTDAFADTAVYTDGTRENGILYMDQILIDCTAETKGEIDIKDGVKTIADSAFMDAVNITAVNCPDSVLYVGQNVFNGCVSLKNADINLAEAIGRNVFTGCDNLAVIEVSDDNAFFAVHDGVLLDKEKITAIRCPQKKAGSIELPDTTKKIAAYSFTGCTELEQVRIPEGVIFIGYEAFKGCGIRELVLPDSLEYVASYAFSECHGITQVEIPTDVAYLGACVFLDCNSLQSAEFGERFGELDSGTFAYCENLESVNIINSLEYDLTYIAGDAFEGTKLIENISNYRNGMLILNDHYLIKVADDVSVCNIPQGVICIAGSAFGYEDTALRKIKIPSSVSASVWPALYFVDSSVKVHYNGTAEEFEDIYGYIDDLNLYTNDLRNTVLMMCGLLVLTIGFIVGVKVYESVQIKKEWYEENEEVTENED